MAVDEPHGGAGIYVRMALGAEEYALPVQAVVEIADLHEVTPMPGAPAAVLGVCNLRGNVLPVVDLGAVLGTPESGSPARRLIVAEHGGSKVGLAVDSVIDVRRLPGITEATHTEHLDGAVLVQGALVGFLELDSLLTAVKAGA